MEIDIELYETLSGTCPFEDWFEDIGDAHTKAKIMLRLDRLRLGNFGNCKSIGDGIAELKIDYGPGFRIYYSKTGSTVILLLCGGDKGAQRHDITKAKEYLKDYHSRGGKHGKK